MTAMQENATASAEEVKELFYTKAAFAIAVAEDLFENAKSNLEINNEECFKLAKNSIRVAASALLLNDGQVSDNFEATYEYIKKKYEKRFPVDEWKELEGENIDKEGALTKFLQRAGIVKKSSDNAQEQANQAIALAEVFINLTRETIMG